MANNTKTEELDWVKVREDLNSMYVTETTYDKASRKIRENPLVPLGALATTAALSVGLISFYQGKTQMQQYMMRARVGAQAFTIVCIVAGLIMLPRGERK